MQRLIEFIKKTPSEAIQDDRLAREIFNTHDSLEELLMIKIENAEKDFQLYPSVLRYSPWARQTKKALRRAQSSFPIS